MSAISSRIGWRKCSQHSRCFLFGFLHRYRPHSDIVLCVLPWNSTRWAVVFQCTECGRLNTEGNLTQTSLLRRGIPFDAASSGSAFPSSMGARPIRRELPDVLIGLRSPQSLVLFGHAHIG